MGWISSDVPGIKTTRHTYHPLLVPDRVCGPGGVGQEDEGMSDKLFSMGHSRIPSKRITLTVDGDFVHFKDSKGRELSEWDIVDILNAFLAMPRQEQRKWLAVDSVSRGPRG